MKVSVHFPKTGGTALHLHLAGVYGERFHLDRDHDPLGPAPDGPAALPPGVEVVHGHFRPGIYDALKPTLRWTFLRDPVDVFLSIYFYWRTLPPGGHAVRQRFHRENPSIFELARWPGQATLMSERYFGGYDMDRFDLIGRHETFKEDSARLLAMLGLPQVELPEINVTPPSEERQALENDPAAMGRLRDLLRPDVEFYERLLSRRGLAAV